MKRFPVVIGATAAGLAGVLAFHSRPSFGSPATAPASPAASPGGPTTTTTSGATPSHSTTTTLSPGGSARATGTSEQYGFGVLSVQVSTSGSRITDVAVASLQTAETYSTQLADQVVPMLRREVLAAQSARIAAISGATYTSEAYAASVQSAIDKLHLG